MGDELTILLEAFHKKEKAGGQATLSVSTSCGKTKVKLVTSTTAAPPSVSPSTSSTPGRLHRRRSARARARRNLRAAAHQASLAEAATSVPLDPPRPLHLHPSPPPASGRRQVTTVARSNVPTFPTLNVDGPSSPPPASPPPLFGESGTAESEAQVFKCDAFDSMNHACELEFESEDTLGDHLESHGEFVSCPGCKHFFYDCDEATACPGCLRPWPYWRSHPR